MRNNWLLLYNLCTFLKVHENAMKTVNVATKCYLRSYNFLLQTNWAKYFLTTTVEYFLNKSPIRFFIHFEQMMRRIFRHISNINNHSQPSHKMLFCWFRCILFSNSNKSYLLRAGILFKLRGSIISACKVALKPRSFAGT